MRPARHLVLLTIVGLISGCGGGPPGVPLGETIAVGYTDTGADVHTSLDVTVTAVRTGTVEELEAAGLSFDEEERSLVPHYVDATYANTGEGTVERTMRPALEDGDGNLLSATVIFDFSGGEGDQGGPCVGVDDGPLAPGESFSDCTLFLVPADITPAVASFLSQPAEGEPEFVYWTIE